MSIVNHERRWGTSPVPRFFCPELLHKLRRICRPIWFSDCNQIQEEVLLLCENVSSCRKVLLQHPVSDGWGWGEACNMQLWIPVSLWRKQNSLASTASAGFTSVFSSFFSLLSFPFHEALLQHRPSYVSLYAYTSQHKPSQD